MLYGAAAIGMGMGAAAWRRIKFKSNLKRVDLSFSVQDIKECLTVTINFPCKNCVCEVCRD